MAGSRGDVILGFQEWVRLPQLAIPAIRAKVDTGARTSALHAFTIQLLGSDAAPIVRFGVHPIPGREDIEIYCTVPLLDRRHVTSSNGERELRPVVATEIAMGERVWPVEITLTNRETMSHRMLLGRTGLPPGALIDPSASFLQPRLSHRLYGPAPAGRRRAAVPRPKAPETDAS